MFLLKQSSRLRVASRALGLKKGEKRLAFRERSWRLNQISSVLDTGKHSFSSQSKFSPGENEQEIDTVAKSRDSGEEGMSKWEYFFAGKSSEERTRIESMFYADDPEWQKNYLSEEELDLLSEERKAQLDAIFVKSKEEKEKALYEVIGWMADKKEIEDVELPDHMIPVLEVVDKIPMKLEYKMDFDSDISPAVPYPKVKLEVELKHLGLSSREKAWFAEIVGPRLNDRLRTSRTNKNPGKRDSPVVKFTCDTHEDHQQNTWAVKKLLYDCISKAKEVERKSRSDDDIEIII